jgi:hypothetical protein
MQKAAEEGRIKDGIYDPSLPVYTAWDIGWSDATAIWWFQICGGEVRLIDYYYDRQQDPRYLAEQVWGRRIPEEFIKYGANGKILSFEVGPPIPDIERRASYQYSEHYLPHDAANKLLAAGGRSTVDQLHELGLKCRIVAATSQQNQIDGTRLLINRCWYEKTLCAEGIKCMKKYAFRFKENASSYSDEPDHDLGGYSHACDAHEIIAQVWRTAKTPEIAPEPKFWQDLTINELFHRNEGNDGGYQRI